MSAPDRRTRRPLQETSHTFGLVRAGEQAVGEAAFEEHALAMRQDCGFRLCLRVLSDRPSDEPQHATSFS